MTPCSDREDIRENRHRRRKGGAMLVSDDSDGSSLDSSDNDFEKQIRKLKVRNSDSGDHSDDPLPARTPLPPLSK